MPALTRAVDRGDEGDLGAPGRGLLGEGVALLARRPVADEADRVDRLAGAARGDQHRQPGEVAAVDGAGEDALDRGHDGGSGAASRPAPTSPPARRPSSGGTMWTPRARAAPRGCRAPTGAPTSRCAWPGATTTGARVASSVAVSRSSERPEPVGGEQPGRGRRHDHQVGRPGRAGCAGSGWSRPTATSAPARMASAERVTSPTKRRAPSVMTGDDVGAGVDQAAAELDGLVGRDAAGDPEDDALPGEHGAATAERSLVLGVLGGGDAGSAAASASASRLAASSSP